MEHDLMRGETAAAHPGTPTAFNGSGGHAGRLLLEREWVESFLRLCGRDMRPEDRRRWLAKHEADSASLERAVAKSWRAAMLKRPPSATAAPSAP